MGFRRLFLFFPRQRLRVSQVVGEVRVYPRAQHSLSYEEQEDEDRSDVDSSRLDGNGL